MAETVEANSFRIAADDDEPRALLTVKNGKVVPSGFFATLTPEQQAAALANNEVDV
jgi:hypothetical protein